MGEKKEARIAGLSMTAVFAVGAVLLYCSTSMSMTFINKATLMYYNKPMSLLLLQMLSTIAIVVPLKSLRVVQFPDVTRDKCKKLLPVTVLYTGNVAFALVGLGGMNVPMYNALKRLTPVFILAAKSLMTGVGPDLQVTGSVLLIVSGCIVAALGDFGRDLWAYSYAIMSCTLQTAYLLLVERTGAKKDATTTEMLYYNAFLALPFILLMMLVQGEWTSAWPDFVAGCEAVGWINLSALVVLTSGLGTLLNFALFWCTNLNTALTTTVAGVMKGVIQTILGFFILGGVRYHPLNVTGIIMNCMGGVWYSWIKYTEKNYQRIERKGSEADLEESKALTSKQ